MIKPRPMWRKSSHSDAEGACVEVGTLRPGVAIRDSKDPNGPHLHLSASEWRRLLTAIRSGH